jgi:2-polyprenyl-6-hydroxyphenyl methylase/3-demethylubiquinone-9 3-methyltransferase
MSQPSLPSFDFGANWQEFSAHALTAEKVAESRDGFIALMEGVPLRDSTFLDIGFGQGLGLLAATSLGARTHGCDINPKCAEVLRQNLRHFPGISSTPSVTVGSILDASVVSALRAVNPAGFDIVHSWGVLHHTGNMVSAVRQAAGLVAPGGYLIVAIYNRHWSSPLWWLIKRTYVSSPSWLRRFYVGILYPVIYVAKWAVTKRRTQRQERGMDFYYDVIDWVGGYPYEYASEDEVVNMVTMLGFVLVRARPATVPTGCNEFVFRRH